MPGVRELLPGWDRYWRPISPHRPFKKTQFRFKRVFFFTLGVNVCVILENCCWVSLKTNDLLISKALSDVATTAELTEGARQLPRELKTSLWFVCHYGNQAPLTLQTENRRLRQIGNVLFCQSQSSRQQERKNGVSPLAPSSKEEKGFNESWHGFICTAHIINISEE